jgi:hypothetical protein
VSCHKETEPSKFNFKKEIEDGLKDTLANNQKENDKNFTKKKRWDEGNAKNCHNLLSVSSPKAMNNIDPFYLA